MGRGEIDLIAIDDGERVAVEVKSRLRSVVDPMENFTDAKQRQVRTLARNLRPAAFRVDFVGISVHDTEVVIRWLPRAV